MTLIALGVGGMGALIARQPGLAAAATWGGALFLLIYGARSFRSAFAPGALSVDSTADPPSRGATLLAALGFSLLNPHVYLDTVVLLGSVGTRFPEGQRSGFAAGAMLVFIVWLFGLSYWAGQLAPLFRRPAAWRVLDVAVGFTMWAIAASLMGVTLLPALAVLLLLAVLLALAGCVYQTIGNIWDALRYRHQRNRMP
jgi:L-lysine exporter family protein LysE/ArgO